MHNARNPQPPTEPAHKLIDAAVGLFSVSGFSSMADRLGRSVDDEVRSIIAFVQDLFEPVGMAHHMVWAILPFLDPMSIDLGQVYFLFRITCKFHNKAPGKIQRP